MNPQQSLQLHDIHLPGDPSIWPLAIGWWLLIAIALLLLVYLFIKVRRHLYIKKYKKMLRNEYAALEKKLKESPDKNHIAEANVLLRRFALAYYPDQNTASLTGSDWLSFLDTTGNTQDFSRGAGRILIDAPYRAGDLENYNEDEFIPLIHSWVNQTIRTRVNNRLVDFKQPNHKLAKKVGGCL